MPGVLGLGVTARGLLVEIADSIVRGREKLKSNPLNELRGRCQVAGPYLPFGRYSNLPWGRSSSFNFFDTELWLLLFRSRRFLRHVRMVSINRGARTARSTIGTAMAMVKVPDGSPGLEGFDGSGVVVERPAIDDEIEELVAVVRPRDCLADADLKGIVSVMIAITVVVVVAVGRRVTCGVAEGCALPPAGLLLSPAEAGERFEFCTTRFPIAIVGSRLWRNLFKTDYTGQYWNISHTNETLKKEAEVDTWYNKNDPRVTRQPIRRVNDYNLQARKGG